VRHWIVVAAGIAALSCVAAASRPSALVYEPFEERSQLLSSRGVATSFMISLVELHELFVAAERKFGKDVETSLDSDTGTVETKLDGKVVETSVLKARVQDVFGIFLVGSRRGEMARFPFSFGVADQRERPGDIGETVRRQFPQLSDFTDADWATLRCWSQEAPEAGAQFTGAEPRLGRAELCLVRWQRGEPKTMLIGALAADGGDWVSDASRPICRVLAARWLELPESGVQDGTIDYVGCVLVHDPDRGTRGASETVADHLYEVHADRSLALIN
jgi:hypothetical protein